MKRYNDRKTLYKKLIWLRRKCREDFAAFLTFVYNFPMAPMHKEWAQALQTESRIVIAAPRGHAKSSVVSLAYPAWRIGLNPNIRIKIVTNNIEEARKIVTAVSTTLMFNDKYRFIFPHVRPARFRFWTRDRIYVERTLVLRDPTLEARSVLSTGAGGRADLLICDDVCDNLNTVTETLRRKVKEAFYDVWMNTLEPKANQVIVVGTIWDEDDLLSELLRNEGWGYRKMWAIDESFTPLWPQVWTREKLYQRWKQNPLAFDKGFRHRPLRAEDALFPVSSFKQRKDWPLAPGTHPPEFRTISPSRIHVYAGVDLSTGRGQDYSVLFFVGVEAESKLRWPIDIVRVKRPAPDVIRLLIRYCEKYKPEVVLVESNATQGMMREIIEEVSNLPIKPYYTGTQKHSLTVGLPSLRVELDNNLWLIPSWNHESNCDCAWCVWKREVLSYPYMRTDDTVLAWWFAREAIRLYFENKSRKVGYVVLEI